MGYHTYPLVYIPWRLVPWDIPGDQCIPWDSLAGPTSQDQARVGDKVSVPDVCIPWDKFCHGISHGGSDANIPWGITLHGITHQCDGMALEGR